MELSTRQDDFAAYRSLQFVRGLKGFSDTTPSVWVRGDCWPPYQEVITRYPLSGSSKLLSLVHYVKGQSNLSFGLIVPDDRRHQSFVAQNKEHSHLTGTLWAWSSKSRHIFCKQFDSKNNFGGAKQIVHHDCNVTDGSELSVHHDPKNKTVHFIIDGKEGKISISRGSWSDFCYGYARLTCKGNDSKIQVTLIPVPLEAPSVETLVAVTSKGPESCWMPVVRGLKKLLTADLPQQVHQVVPELSFYKTINKRPRGICLMINNGPNLNLEKQLTDLFKSLAFDVRVEQNLRMVAIYEVIRKIAEEDHSRYDSFVFITMSVSRHDHEISGLDGRNASLEQVMSEFKATKCPSLQNKPKLFFVWRFTMPLYKFGESHDSFMMEPYCTDEAEPSAAAGAREDICPEAADFLLTCVTSSVDESQQVPESSFNQVLVKVVKNYCYLGYHLLEILTKVNEVLVDMNKQTGQSNGVPLVQVPYLTHTLTAKVRLDWTPSPNQDTAPNIPDTPKLIMNRYEINRNPRGYCVIVNNLKFHDKNMPDRIGAREDEKSLQKLFSDLKFNVVIVKDLDKHAIEREAEKFGRKDHRDFSAFVFILMSHGGDRDCILGVKGRKTTVENLMVEFQARKCPSLKGKPKVFIIQTCRGLLDVSETFTTSISSINTQTVLSTSQQADTPLIDPPVSFDSTLPKSVFPSEADFLLAFATMPGYVSFRLPESGTFFIQALIEVIREHHDRHHLLDILTEVTKRVVDRQNSLPNMGCPVQVPAPMHTLTKQLYL